jgi:uncharacterized membrane protein
MQGLQKSFSHNRYRLALGGLLVAASVFSVLLERTHTLVNGSQDYPFLNFNLALAWIPLLAALAASVARRNRITFFLVMPLCTVLWLMFFPNAPYLLTDFQHLSFSYGSSPVWLDVILLIWFAWTGLLLGIASLYLMQEIVTRAFNREVGWIFAIVAVILSSVGVYLGRFLRWNSWDLLQDPLSIARDMYGIVRHPLANLPTYVFTILFTLLFLFIYVTIHLFGRIVREQRTEIRDQ